MKYLFLIILMLILSCGPGEDKAIKSLNEGIERVTLQTEIINDKLLTDIQGAYQANQKKNINHEVNANKSNEYSNEILDLAKRIGKGISTKNPIPQNLEKEKLFSLIKTYDIFLDSIIISDTSFHAFNKISTKINIKQLKDLNLSSINLLANQLNIINYQVLKFYRRKAISNISKFNKNEIVVIPKSKYIFEEDHYQTNIQIITIDTALEYWAIFNKNKIDSRKAKVTYTDINTLKPKTVNKKGFLQIIYPASGEILSFPFFLKYQIKEQ